jgi:hypothetical protein
LTFSFTNRSGNGFPGIAKKRLNTKWFFDFVNRKIASHDPTSIGAEGRILGFQSSKKQVGNRKTVSSNGALLPLPFGHHFSPSTSSFEYNLQVILRSIELTILMILEVNY